MTKLYIAEFPGIADGFNRGGLDIVDYPPIAEQTVAVGSSAANSAPFSAETHIISVESDVVCSITISRGPPATGVTPAATANNRRIAANSAPELISVQPGSVLSVITNT